MAEHILDKFTYGGDTFILQDNNSGYTKNTGTITKITTTAGAHTAIDVSSGEVSFNVPTTASHVGAAATSHAHGNITSSGDITATAPTIANGDQIVINDSSASKITNGPTFDGSTTNKYLSPKGTWESLPQGTAYQAGTGLSLSGTTFNHSNSVTAQTTSAVYPITIDAQGHINSIGTAVTIPSITLNGSVTTSPSFYAPTGVGTNGYVLKSNGSGAPTWTSAVLTDTTYSLSNALSSHKFTWTLIAGGSGSGSTTTSAELVAGTGISLTDDTTNKKITIASTVTAPTITLNGSTTTTPSFYAPTAAGTSGQILTSSGSGAPTWAAAPAAGTQVQIVRW